ncbi:hypothetical protein, partial [Klebsiella pneumoniae]
MSKAAAAQPSFWKRSHHLDRMTLRELVAAYFQHYTILSYLALLAGSIMLFVLHPASAIQAAGIVVLIALAYPLVWYGLHRWVLHCHWMFKVPALAAVWKRIHYDHHQDPNHLEVLFGA